MLLIVLFTVSAAPFESFLKIVKELFKIPPFVESAPMLAGVIPKLLLAPAALVAPVPPFSTGSIPEIVSKVVEVPPIDLKIARILLPSP